MTTIEDAKKELRSNFLKGTKCPCCGQFVKQYRRKLNSGMARTLIKVYNHHKQNEVNVKQFLRVHGFQNNHDWTILRYWGLIEELPNKSDGKTKTSGVWKITDKGVYFVNNSLTLPSHVLIYNKVFMGYDGKEIDIIQALGKHFNYYELMNNNHNA